MTRPLAGGSRASSNAWAATGRGPATPASRIASARISATPSAPCSDVPHPVTTMGSPNRASSRIAAASRAAPLSAPASRPSVRSASAGSAAIISVM